MKTEKTEKLGKPPEENEREMIQKNANKINSISNNNISNNSISSSSAEMRSVDNNFNVNFNFKVKRNFKWCWWECKAPYCPYCGILMQPLT